MNYSEMANRLVLLWRFCVYDFGGLGGVGSNFLFCLCGCWKVLILV
jgi:hypothetical protein